MRKKAIFFDFFHFFRVFEFFAHLRCRERHVESELILVRRGQLERGGVEFVAALRVQLLLDVERLFDGLHALLELVDVVHE